MRKMILVTDSFPYGKGEKSFIMPELPYLQKNYDLTIITKAGKEQRRDVKNITKLDRNIKIINIPSDRRPKILKVLKAILGMPFYLFDRKVRWELKEIIRQKNALLKLFFMFLYYANARDFYGDLRKTGIFSMDEKNIIFYTYWNNYATLALLMQKKQMPNIKVITRTHRYDLYNEAVIGGKQPFRNYINLNIDGIFFISQEGMDYYVDKFSGGVVLPIFRLCRLGIPSHNLIPMGKEKNAPFRLVSCSNVIPLKRVGFIVRALAALSLDKVIDWVHFGDGIEMDAVRQMALELLGDKTNIRYKFMGFCPNDKIMQYYSRHYIDCFITVSSSEGLPVSIMEACSFGIPVIATNVGGIPEIVEDSMNGFLLPSDPNIEEIAGAIGKLYDLSEEHAISMRRNSRRIWEERFDSDRNYSCFVDYIKNNIEG